MTSMLGSIFSNPLLKLCKIPAGLPMVMVAYRRAGWKEEVSAIVSDVEGVLRQRFSGTILGVLNPRLEIV